MKSKLFLRLFVAISLIVSCPAISRADDHEHSYGDYVYNGDASYSQAGTKTGTCSCGAKETIEDTTHPQWTYSVDPQSTDYGTVYTNLTNGGKIIQMTAMAKTNYKFSHWLIGGTTKSTDATYTYTKGGNVTAIAYYTTTLTLYCNSSYSYGCTIQGNGACGEKYDLRYRSSYKDVSFDIECGSKLYLTADKPMSGYYFRWDDGKQDLRRDVILTKPTGFGIIYNLQVYASLDIYVNDKNLGKVSQEGNVACEADETQLTAIPYQHCHFVKWEDGSTQPTRKYVAHQGINTVTAYFAKDTHTIQTAVLDAETSSEDASLGDVTGSGTYDYGTYVILTANVSSLGCRFVSWSDGNTDNPRTIVVSGDETYSAKFSKHSYGDYVYNGDASYSQAGTKTGTCSCGAKETIEDTTHPQWTYSVDPQSTDYGIVSTTLTDGGKSIQMTAEAKTDYKFSHWLIGGTTKSTDATYTYTKGGNVTAIAYYTTTLSLLSYNVHEDCNINGTSACGKERYHLTYHGHPSGVYEAETYDIECGTTLVLWLPDPRNGCYFCGWGDGIKELRREVTMTKPMGFSYAYAWKKSACVTWICFGDGYVKEEVKAEYDGDYGRIVAYPREHSHFVKWGDGVTGRIRDFIAGKDGTKFEAYFAKDTHTIQTAVLDAETSSEDASLGVVTGTGTYDYGTSITLTATPSVGCRFESWSDGNTDNPRTISVSGDETYSAKFSAGVETFALSDTQEFTASRSFKAGTVTYQRTMSSQWGTIVLPFDVTIGGDVPYDFYEISEVNAETLVLTKLSGTLSAGHPALIRISGGEVANGKTYDLTLQASDVTVSPDLTTGSHNLTGAYIVTEVDNGYIISNNSFWSVSNLKSIDDLWGGLSADDRHIYCAPYRAFLAGSSGAAELRIGVSDPGSETALDVLNSLSTGEGWGEVIYDLNGRKLNDLQQGVNIIKKGNKSVKVVIK